ncbi:conserved hypothetical protein [Cupriavidus taiwanensis]|uniref:ATP-dependent nuclease n=1 Tax=Cupriavidus taiwanensis TaxID=164546 RepID=UPI000E194516|nr:AAA family ATPase [Cupriavidus taiwanensis]SOY93384.1 conserved hypothetical protein [Cupriavidus taiwanensis]SOY96370.1 conserved hypothetical protein [Cupriavidus taiwanensis]
MRIKAIWIKNFRGIKALTWYPSPGLNCLIGPGDGGKTSVLDAIELLLSERHNITFDDTDFFEGLTRDPIFVAATFTDLPVELKRDDKYGLALSGWGANGFAPEPSEAQGVQAALTLRLDVDSTLEPRWSVHVERAGLVDASTALSFQDRKYFAPARLGTYADRHLSWGRGSSLQKVSAHPEQLPATLNELMRSTRATFAKDSAAVFDDVIKAVQPDMEGLGVRLQTGLVANLDRASLSINASGVSLHDGDVPLRCAGTGTTRLAVAALQSAQAAERRFLLVDELEFGLEPHRVSLLINHLRARTATTGQAFVTTHSPVVLREAKFDEVHVCRRDKSGVLNILAANEAVTSPLDSKRYVRDKGEALLATSVLVCEGQTEVALLKGFSSTRSVDFQSRGVVFVDGGGDPSCFGVAMHFARMGYRTALLTDSDKVMDPKIPDALKGAGVSHFRWGQQNCTEVELFSGLPVLFRQQLLELVAEQMELQRLLGEFSAAVSHPVHSLEHAKAFLADDAYCVPVGTKASYGKWIKRDYDLCRAIGERILSAASPADDGTLAKHLNSLSKWMTQDA